GFFFIVFGVIMVIAATFTINPVWNYGGYDPSPVSAGTQPDWYIGWLDGALRLAPSHLETYWFGYTWSWNILLPLIISLVFLFVVAAYPFLEKWVTGDEREHHVLDRPRNAPVRTAIGAAGMTFYAVLWAGASTDLIATNFKMSLNNVLTFMQISLIVLPFVAFWVAKRTALSLQRKDNAIALHGRETGRIVRMPHGEYIEVHEPVNKYELYKLTQFDSFAPTLARPDADGKITTKARLRASLSKFYFKDRVEPATQIEIDAAHGHQDDHEPKKAIAAKKAPAKATAKKPAAKKAAAKPAAKKAAPKK
ncbi:MAG: ubiquinol-cytochrome c reductase cytochrome b subunit, partial [Micrococcales bacterium]